MRLSGTLAQPTLCTKPVLLTCGPRHHLNWNPDIRAELLGDHLRGKLGGQETKIENSHPIIVVCRGEPEICEHVVRERLRNVASIQLKSKEHQADPGADSEVKLPQVSAPKVCSEQMLVSSPTYTSDQLLLFFVGPSRLWIVPMTALILRDRFIEPGIAT